MGKFLDEQERQREAYNAKRQEYIDAGIWVTSIANELKAENTVSGEIGEFAEGENDRDPDEYRDALIIKARRDALISALNSNDSLDAIEQMQRDIKTQHRMLQMLVIGIAILVANELFS